MDNNEHGIARRYAEQLATQMRKGLLSYLVLVVAEKPIYTSDIIGRLSQAGLTVVEGTIYPLLLRLQRDGLLQHEWREDKSGRPLRKYYCVTKLGKTVAGELKQEIKNLNQATSKLEKKETK